MLAQVIFYVGLIAVWQLVAMLAVWPSNIFPSPYEVGEDIMYGILDATLFYGLGASMSRLLIGLAVSILGGILLGVLMARVELVNNTIGSLVLGLQSIPSIAWVPLGILWFGLTDAGIIFVVIIGAIFAVTINTYTGIKNIEPDILQAADNMGSKGNKLVIDVLLPAAFPFLISGFKQGWAFAWRGVIGAELLFSYLGLGYMLYVGRSLNDISQVIAIMIIIMMVGLVVDAIVFKRLEKYVRYRWGIEGELTQ